MDNYSNEERIELAQSLDRLIRTNSDFIKVFLQDYQEKYVLGLVKDLARYAANHPDYANTVRKIEAVSLFNTYINDVIEQGQSARDDLDYLSRTPDIEE